MSPRNNYSLTKTQQCDRARAAQSRDIKPLCSFCLRGNSLKMRGRRFKFPDKRNEKKKTFHSLTFRTCLPSGSVRGPRRTHGSADRPRRCDSDILRQFSLNISRQKRNKNGSLIFIRRDAIFCRPPKKNFLGAWTCCREDGGGEQERPDADTKVCLSCQRHEWLFTAKCRFE